MNYIDQDIKKEFHQEQVKKNIWILSFVDITCLLITFFILLYSVSNKTKTDLPKISKYANLKKNMQIEDEEYIDQDYTFRLIKNALKDNSILNKVTLEYNYDDLILSIPVSILFIPYTAELKPTAINIINSIQTTLQNLENQVAINGVDSINYTVAKPNKANLKLPLLWSITIASKFKEMGYEYNIDTYGLSGKDYRLEAKKDNKDYYQRIDIIISDKKAK
jgi:chemotaxis protein MotB